jgi:hypothetical protein
MAPALGTGAGVGAGVGASVGAGVGTGVGAGAVVVSDGAVRFNFCRMRSGPVSASPAAAKASSSAPPPQPVTASVAAAEPDRRKKRLFMMTACKSSRAGLVLVDVRLWRNPRSDVALPQQEARL